MLPCFGRSTGQLIGVLIRDFVKICCIIIVFQGFATHAAIMAVGDSSLGLCTLNDQTSCPTASSSASCSLGVNCSLTSGAGTYTCRGALGSCVGSVCPGALSGRCDDLCKKYKDCSQCANAINCGWCPSEDLCLFGNNLQSTSTNFPKCSGTNWQYYGTCGMRACLYIFMYVCMCVLTLKLISFWFVAFSEWTVRTNKKYLLTLGQCGVLRSCRN